MFYWVVFLLVWWETISLINSKVVECAFNFKPVPAFVRLNGQLKCFSESRFI